MLIVIGYLVVVASIFVSYLGLGGHLGALYQPFEFLLIGGLALGAYIAANSMSSISALAKALPGAFRRSKHDKALYMELMALLYVILNKIRREGMMSIEADIDDPASSAIFKSYPRVMEDPRVAEFLTDYLRLMVSGNMSSYEVETLMDEEIETFVQENNVPPSALHVLADALPAFGIVAAVLGMIKALASVDEPPAVLADLISKAMVGTFLGILLAYGFVSPLANSIERRNVASVKVLECIKVTLLASLNGYPPQLAVEFGRKVLFTNLRPSYVELEEHVRQTRSNGKKADA